MTGILDIALGVILAAVPLGLFGLGFAAMATGNGNDFGVGVKILLAALVMIAGLIVWRIAA